MQQNYGQYIKNSIDNTIMYSEKDMFSLKNDKNVATEIVVEGIDTVAATMNIYKENPGARRRVCVLNFASYKEPGGMFIEGSKAQEECICHESTLYPVLKEFNDTYYAQNNQAKNKALYLNRALYSPEIVFVHNNEAVLADVLTCAAPNFAAAKKYCNVSEDENLQVLRNRCEFVLDIMQANNVNVPILGAYGCGVFGQDAKVVATIFKELLMKSEYTFEKVVFAVIPGPNLDDFKAVFANPIPIENKSVEKIKVVDSNGWVDTIDSPTNESNNIKQDAEAKEFVSLGMVELNSETELYLIKKLTIMEPGGDICIDPYIESEAYTNIICFGISGVRKFLENKRISGEVISEEIDLRNLPIKMVTESKCYEDGGQRHFEYVPIRIPIENMFM